MKISSIAIALLLGVQSLPAAELPSAGTQIQQIPAQPRLPPREPLLPVPKRESPPVEAGGATIAVRELRISNAVSFTEQQLLEAIRFVPGSELTLSALRATAADIADYYRNRGYFLAEVHVPAQTVTDGVVTLVVTEGRYGQVTVQNRSSLSESVAMNLLDGLNPGDAITLAPLESRLLQLADLPGVIVRSTLVPGASVGASDLVVDIAPGERFNGSIDVDNAGNRYTGRHRTGGTLRLNTPFGLGDAATLRAFTSWDGLTYGRGAYQLQLGRVDAGLAFTALRYRLGEEFASLDAQGTAQIASLYGRYPLLRSRAMNLHVVLGFDAKRFSDHLDAVVPAIVADRRASVGMLSLVGDARDDFGGGGQTRGTLTWTSGNLSLRSDEVRLNDRATARSAGHYDKVGVSLSRLQQVTPVVSLYASFQGQLGAQNLDVSEKLGLGGSGGVRAYPEGEAYVDQGYIVSGEARFLVTPFSELLPGNLQVLGFADNGAGRVNRDPWAAGDNRRRLSGAGVGLTWFDASTTVRAVYAHKLGSAAATSAPDSDSRIWVSAIKTF